MPTVPRLLPDAERFGVAASERWVRGIVDGVTVVDSRAQTLVWTPRFTVPRYAFRHDDVRMDLLGPAATAPIGRSFFVPAADTATWFDLRVGDRLLPNAAWVWNDPDLRDLVALTWEPGVLDRWLEEDEEVVMHPRDPYKRVDALPSTKHVVVSLGGVVLAESRDPVVLYETHLPTRYYLPAADVDFRALEPLDMTSICPYKGTADRYWGVRAHPELGGLAWAYSAPRPAVAPINDRIAFYNEFVDIAVDGVALPRADSEFSRP